MFYEEMRENIYSVHIYLQIRDMARGAAGGGGGGVGRGTVLAKSAIGIAVFGGLRDGFIETSEVTQKSLGPSVSRP